jgi:hypothetical protein
MLQIPSTIFVFHRDLFQDIWMSISYMYLHTALVFSLMWAVRTLELGLLATLKPYMPYHVLLIPITSLTLHALEIILSPMMCHHSILESYWHEWKLHIYARNSLLPHHADISMLSVRLVTAMTGGLVKV